MPETFCESQNLNIYLDKCDDTPKDLYFVAKTPNNRPKLNNRSVQNNKDIRGDTDFMKTVNNFSYGTINQQSDCRENKVANYFIKKSTNDQFDSSITTRKGFYGNNPNSNKNRNKSLNFIKKNERIRNKLNSYSDQDTKQLTNINLINYKKGDMCKNGNFFTKENRTRIEAEKRPVFISKRIKDMKGNTLVKRA